MGNLYASVLYYAINVNSLSSCLFHRCFPLHVPVHLVNLSDPLSVSYSGRWDNHYENVNDSYKIYHPRSGGYHTIVLLLMNFMLS